MTLPFDTNPTQVAGLLAFASSALACAWAAWRDSRRAWAVLAAVHAVLWFDILLNTRHRLHDWVNTGLRAVGAYDNRAVLQVLLLVAALGVLVVAAVFIWRSRRRANSAVLATIGLIALMLTEAISWHLIDRVLYTHLGPLLLVGYAWLLGAAVVVWSALRQVGRIHGLDR